MKLAHASFLLVAVIALAPACAKPPPLPVDRDEEDPCADEGDRCTCDDGSRSALICEDDALFCDCSDLDQDDEQEEQSTPRMDAGRRTDAGRDASARTDAGAEAAPDAAEEEEPPPEEEPPGPKPRIPPMPSDCPEIATGTITVLGQRVQLWVGPKQPGKRGPILFYWHGTGSTAIEAQGALGRGNEEILAEGGVIASFSTTTRRGQNTGNSVWFTGDFDMADQILACAIAQQDVDPRRVYTAGCSAGGLQASAMVYARSSYLAAAMPNSGGTVFAYQLEDPSHVPAFIGTHGAAGRDVVIIDFAQTTTRQVRDLASRGGFAVQCDHGGGHCRSPLEVKNAQWQFLKDHPFGVEPEPYASGLPSGFPSVCQIVR